MQFNGKVTILGTLFCYALLSVIAQQLSSRTLKRLWHSDLLKRECIVGRINPPSYDLFRHFGDIS